MLTEITIENFRCFHEEQTARLAPLTLLVGENSTGKTSFMAMIRAMWEMAHNESTPDFRAPPYDLGSFNEIAHKHGSRGEHAATFKASISVLKRPRQIYDSPIIFSAEFARRGIVPSPIHRRISDKQIWIGQAIDEFDHVKDQIGTERGKWERVNRDGFDSSDMESNENLWPRFLNWLNVEFSRPGQSSFTAVKPSPPIQSEDTFFLSWLAKSRQRYLGRDIDNPIVYAGAPVRSVSERIYDPVKPIGDPSGDNIPLYLSRIAALNDSHWKILKSALGDFGTDSGLFDEIRVRSIGKDIDLFQIQVRKGSKTRKGAWHSLVDVGYGVSQILPVITQLLRPDAPHLSFWQQPEVHLHPSAQAALGTFFCGRAANGKQLIVETHSDHLLDRVRMDVRDGKTGLKPEDVSILYFERTGLDVQIHSLRFDAQGNVLDAPPGYRQFFLEEVNRSLGI